VLVNSYEHLYSALAELSAVARIEESKSLEKRQYLFFMQEPGEVRKPEAINIPKVGVLNSRMKYPGQPPARLLVFENRRSIPA